MKKAISLLIIFAFLLTNVTSSFARSRCCSHHGGVSGCGCGDGTPLSQTCLPYYPQCSAPVQIYSTATPTYAPTATPTVKPTPKPKKVVKKVVKKVKTVKKVTKKPIKKN